MKKKIRVLVVEDSLTIRKYIVEALSSDPEIEVIAEAEDGKQAIELCQALRPDAVTMDMMLPVMSGVAATEYIMAYCPTPILIVSSSVNRGEVFRTYEALSAGAIEALDKPKLGDVAWESKLISLLKIVAKIKVITHPRGRLRQSLALLDSGARQENGDGAIRLIAIGASTGGPAAVAEILRALPPRFPIPIVIVIHISDQFASALAEWLNTQTHLPVRHACDGELVPAVGAPSVLLAPAGYHLCVERERFRLTCEAERFSCRPSVDVLFESIAVEFGPEAVLCLLTGMGKDGATGLLAARRRGAITIAQDEASSVIYGMPGEAARIGAAQRILALDQIAPNLVSLAGVPA